MLFNFRLYSVAAQLLLWSVIGLIFAPLADRLLAPGPASAELRTTRAPPECDPTHAAELAQLGPYFAVSLHSTWPASACLMAAAQHPAGLPGRPAAADRGSPFGARRGPSPAAVEFRVAASVTHLGVAARLISPALGMAVLLGRVPRMDPAEVYWQPVLGGPLPLSLPASALAGHGDQPGTGQLAE